MQKRRDVRSCSQASLTMVLGWFALLALGLWGRSCSAFVSSPPRALSSTVLRRQQGLAGSQCCGVLSARAALPRPKTTTATMNMMFGGSPGSILLDGLRWAGMLLAEEEAAAPNIYGPIALGGVTIVMSGVFGAYVVSLLIKGMTPEQLSELNRGLQGADEMDSIEREEREQQRRFKNLAKDLDEFEDPTGGLGVSGPPKGKRLARMEEETEKARQTDIATIEDEYE